MKTDIAAQIGAMAREVRTCDRDGRPARVVVASRTYATDVDDVWDAITSPERLPRWFLPISGDLRLGGRYQLEGNAGGEVTRCEPPRHLALTWELGGEVSWVEVRLEEGGRGQTRLELQHVAHEDVHWEQFGPGAAGVGWDLGLLGLGQYLAAGASFDRAEAEAWAGSEEGMSFMRRSSERWRDAAIASGTPEEAAQAAAERTIAFYTGEGGE
ncbi:MAG TPA: SRPBCC family protein [Thermoanaerobaculia bacterium]|jgi:uncharacterized protein YndB with AHSA1/START domain